MKNFKGLLNPYRNLPMEMYVIFVSRIVNALGCFVMPLLTIILTQKIELSKEMAGFYISIAGLVYMPMAMIGGKLADTIGRKPVIVVFDIMAIVLYMLCGFIEPSILMVYIIIAAGACMTTAGPAHDSLIADLTTPENRTGAYALSYMGWNIGFAVGPALGGMLYKDHLSLVFIGDAATALVSLALIMLFIKETIHKTNTELPEKAAVTLEKREEGSIFSVLLRRPVLLYFAVIAFGYNFVYSQWSFMMPMHVTQIFGEAAGAKYFGLMASLNGLVVMFCTPLITKLSEKTGNIRSMVYGGIFYAVGFGMLGVTSYLSSFYASVFIFTLGEIVLSISVTPFIVNHTPASHRGRMNAVLPTIMGLGYTLGPIGMGKALSYISLEKGWLFIGLFAAITAALMYGLERYESRKSREAEEAAEIAENPELVKA